MEHLRNDFSFIERIQQLPVFIGLTSYEIQMLLDELQMIVRRYSNGQILAEVDEPCRGFMYVLEGVVESEYSDETGLFRIKEIINGPFLIEPFRAYGMKQKYTRSYTLLTDGSVVFVDKNKILNKLLNYKIAQTNMLNLLSNALQKSEERLRTPVPSTPLQGIQQFIRNHTLTDNGKKQVRIMMEDLAMFVNQTRLQVSRVINRLNDNDIIVKKRSGFIIPDMMKFLQFDNT